MAVSPKAVRSASVLPWAMPPLGGGIRPQSTVPCSRILKKRANAGRDRADRCCNNCVIFGGSVLVRPLGYVWQVSSESAISRTWPRRLDRTVSSTERAAALGNPYRVGCDPRQDPCDYQAHHRYKCRYRAVEPLQQTAVRGASRDLTVGAAGVASLPDLMSTWRGLGDSLV
jgi:hypothetical protein